MHTIAAKAQCFYEALQPEFKEYQDQVIKNAKALSESLQEEGFRIVSNGTDNHLLVVDVKSSVGITGKQAEEVLDKINITVNKNVIPYEKEKVSLSSGIRLGTPAMTTRGLKEQEFRQIGKIISSTLKNIDNEEILEENKKEVLELTNKFPMYK